MARVPIACIALFAVSACFSDAADEGNFVCYTMPWAWVFIDGVDTGRATPISRRNRIALAPGRHEVAFVVEDRTYRHSFVIVAGQTTKLVKQLE